MKRTKEKAEETRILILCTARKIFSDKGYAATKLSDIAQEAGITRGAIYWYFKNKKELFVNIFPANVDPFFETINNILSVELRPINKLEKILSSLFDKIDNNTEFRRNQHLYMFRRNVPENFPIVLEHMRNRIEKFNIIIIKMIVSGQEQGEIRKDIEAETIGNMVIVLIKGYLFIKINESKLPTYQFGSDKQMIDIFIKGIRA